MNTNPQPHTPGPWIVYCAQVIAVTNPDKIICDPFAGFVEASGTNRRQLLPIDEREANARLIAAAPELLASLEAALPELAADSEAFLDGKQEYEPAHNAYLKARAAIARAKGGSGS